jgi:hypothetical protein
MRPFFVSAALVLALWLPAGLALAADGARHSAAASVVQADDPGRTLRRQQQYTATIGALRTLEAMLASATLDDDARADMRSQLEAILKRYEESRPAELKIARLKLEMQDLRDKQGGAISGGNLEVFADQESRLRRRELEILLEIRELERDIGRGRP